MDSLTKQIAVARVVSAALINSDPPETKGKHSLQMGCYTGSYDLAFFFRSAQRAFIMADIFLRAAALMRHRRPGLTAPGLDRPLGRVPVEVMPSMAAMARSMRPRSLRSSVRILLIFIQGVSSSAQIVAVERLGRNNAVSICAAEKN